MLCKGFFFGVGVSAATPMGIKANTRFSGGIPKRVLTYSACGKRSPPTQQAPYPKAVHAKSIFSIAAAPSSTHQRELGSMTTAITAAALAIHSPEIVNLEILARSVTTTKS